MLLGHSDDENPHGAHHGVAGVAIVFGAAYINPFAGDLNADHKPDLILNDLLVLRERSPGRFLSLPRGIFPASGSVLAAADLNGDGLTDLVSSAENAINILVNTSQTSGADLALVLPPPLQSSVAIGGGTASYTATVVNEGLRTIPL